MCGLKGIFVGCRHLFLSTHTHTQKHFESEPNEYWRFSHSNPLRDSAHSKSAHVQHKPNNMKHLPLRLWFFCLGFVLLIAVSVEIVWVLYTQYIRIANIFESDECHNIFFPGKVSYSQRLRFCSLLGVFQQTAACAFECGRLLNATRMRALFLC